MKKIPIDSLPHIGPKLKEDLAQASIETIEELSEIGAEKAFIKLREVNNFACLTMLHAIEGMIQGKHVRYLDKKRKDELKKFFRSIIDSED